MGEDFRRAFLRFEKDAHGNEDVKQRWKSCTVLTSKQAKVGVGYIYVREYFDVQDKKEANDIMTYDFDAYNELVEEASWLSDEAKKTIRSYTDDKIARYTGYHDLLLTEGANYYDEISEFPENEFFKMSLAYKVFDADKRFRNNKKFDWTKYSEPQTVNAYYSSGDDTIRKYFN